MSDSRDHKCPRCGAPLPTVTVQKPVYVDFFTLTDGVPSSSRELLRYETVEEPGGCFRCGAPVPAGEGLMSWTKQGHVQAWPRIAKAMPFALVEHEGCAKKFDGTFVHHIYKPSEENKG